MPSYGIISILPALISSRNYSLVPQHARLALWWLSFLQWFCSQNYPASSLDALINRRSSFLSVLSIAWYSCSVSLYFPKSDQIIVLSHYIMLVYPVSRKWSIAPTGPCVAPTGSFVAPNSPRAYFAYRTNSGWPSSFSRYRQNLFEWTASSSPFIGLFREIHSEWLTAQDRELPTFRY